VSASKGVIGPLLGKLTDLIGDKYFANLLGVSNDDIVFLRDELSTINVLLDKLQDTNELDPQVKNWRDQVREMSYDIEDFIDDFINKMGSTDANTGFIGKVSYFLQTLRAHFEAAKQIKELKNRLHEINERRKRYKFEDGTSRTTLVAADPRLSALYKESTMLVGIEDQKKELTEQIIYGGEQLKVVPVVGFGGLGKTTLAKEVYREVRQHFDCTAFVTVSQNPDIVRLLHGVLSQLLRQDPSSHACDVQYQIDRLGEYLREKRYLIVVDDLWDVLHWDIISSSFPRNDKHSRVIVTTRIKEVARACCSGLECIHNMKPLGELDSRKLFLSRIFGSEAACPPQFTEVSCKILKKCGGLPLAIMTIASTIACGSTRQTVEQWEHIHGSLAAQFATNPTMETMIHILDLSYRNLPRHLKACFLHLGNYPEDWDIRRDDVVREWVAEGFVSNFPGHDAWVVAKSYFNELVNRSIVQPVGFDDDDVRGCRVHDMMLELITRKCREENFITVLRDPQALAAMQGNVRRLSADFRGEEYHTMDVTSASTSRLSQVRSVTIFGESKWVPTLMKFKFLRVLYIDVRDVFKIDLTGICLLSQLRYIKVSCTHYISNHESDYSIVLPAKIRRLQQLETLELPLEPSCSIPSDIIDLPRLCHLVLPWNTRLPVGACKMKSLRTLDGPSAPKSTLEDIKGLGELTNLEDLSLYCHKKPYGNSTPVICSSDDDPAVDHKTWMAALSFSLEKLVNLKYFSLRSSVAYNADALLRTSSGAPLPSLQELHMMEWTFSRVPKWMAHLHNLYHLWVGVKQLLQEDVVIIGALPALRVLNLRIPSSVVPAERIAIGSTTGFAVLESLWLNSDRLSSFLTFEVGAMPMLRMMQLSLDEQEWDKATPSGLHHLSCLKEIHVSKVRYGNDRGATWSEETKDTIKSIFQGAVNAVPSRTAVIMDDGTSWRPREG